MAGVSFDCIVACFIGAADGSSQIFRILRAICKKLQRTLKESTGSTGLPLPDDVMGLQSRLGELLQELSEEGLTVLLVFDAVNELDATHNARALFW